METFEELQKSIFSKTCKQFYCKIGYFGYMIVKEILLLINGQPYNCIMYKINLLAHPIWVDQGIPYSFSFIWVITWLVQYTHCHFCCSSSFLGLPQMLNTCWPMWSLHCMLNPGPHAHKVYMLAIPTRTPGG